MFGIFRKEEPQSSPIDETITNLCTELQMSTAGTEEYTTILDHIGKAMKIKAETEARRLPSPDTKLIVWGNLAGIALIIAFEQKHVITTKAKDWMLRVK